MSIFTLLKTLTRRGFNARKNPRKRIAEGTKKAGKHFKAGLTTKEEAVQRSHEARIGNTKPSIADNFKTKQTREAIKAHNRGDEVSKGKRRTRAEALKLAKAKKPKKIHIEK